MPQSTSHFRGLLRGLLLFAVVLAPGRALAQAPGAEMTTPASSALEGRVLKDGQPVAGLNVTLHRVTPDSAGQIAARPTDDQGRFDFTLTPVEGAEFTVFFTRVEYRSVQYFGRPLHVGDAAEDYEIEIFETTFALADPVRVTRRDVVLMPERAGTWEVNEAVRIRNPTNLTLISETGGGTWEFRIPTGATEFEAGGGDVLPNEIVRMDDRVMLTTPILPGEQEFFIRYRLPERPRRSALPVDAVTDTLNLFVRQPSHLASVAGMTTTRIVDVEGERFLQYGVADLQPGARIDFHWTRAGGPPVDPIVAAASLTLLILGVGVWAARRNRPRPG
jgi:5-hydroxyisourate hydrolase-like protein (transthyretin family)